MSTLRALPAVGTAPYAAHAQQPIKQARIAFIGYGTPEAVGYLLEPFKERMRELGYVDGKTLCSRNVGQWETLNAYPALRTKSWR